MIQNSHFEQCLQSAAPNKGGNLKAYQRRQKWKLAWWGNTFRLNKHLGKLFQLLCQVGYSVISNLKFWPSWFPQKQKLCKRASLSWYFTRLKKC